MAALTNVFPRSSLSNEGDRDALLAHPEALVLEGEGIAEGADQINSIRIYWWLIVFPSGFLISTLLALSFLGDGLRDVWAVDDANRG